MATSIRLIRRYVWLVDTIRRAGSITLEEINRKWACNTSLNIDNEDEIPERTFHRHRDAIAELFDIEIRCNRFDGNRYYIENEESLDKPSFTSWLFNGLSIDNQMIGNREVSERIIFEETPGGNEFLSPIIESLTADRVIKMSYRRFNVSESTEYRAEPYGLKQSGRRWYLIAKMQGADTLKVFALDRIESLKLTDEAFTRDKGIDVKIYFNEVMGVNVDNDFDCETVKLRIYGRQRAYVASLPLHKSQCLVDHTKDYSDYELTLRPEYEFQRAVLALGPEAEILSPQWLREEIKWLAEETANKYCD